MRLKKINKLKNGNLLFAFWANNRGRGNDNCTLQVVSPETERNFCSRLTKNVLNQTRTLSWRGDVNLSKAICHELSIEKCDILS